MDGGPHVARLRRARQRLADLEDRRVGPGGPLASVVRTAAWPVGEPMVAACSGVTFPHRAPSRVCRCGIHVARDAREAAFHAELPSRSGDALTVGLAA